MTTYLNRILFLVIVLGLIISLAGCGSDGGSSTKALFEANLTNLTANQPMAPMAAILHNQNFTAWQLSAVASDGLEQLAEGGDPTAFLTEAADNTDVRDNLAGGGITPPGGSDRVTLSGTLNGTRLSVASMLVNSNDAFTGISGHSLDSLQVGQSIVIDVNSYDAGTEDNSETASGIPGPAGGGEGFNAVRDDRDFIAVHPGVVSADDGLATSVLDESHRIQNPVARLKVTRTD